MINKQYPKEQKKGTIRPFKRAYMQLSKLDSVIAQSVICKYCKLEWKQDFNAYMNGRQPIPQWRQDIIESSFKNFNLNAWTGNPIWDMTAAKIIY
jgi:hypothetical protein